MKTEILYSLDQLSQVAQELIKLINAKADFKVNQSVAHVSRPTVAHSARPTVSHGARFTVAHGELVESIATSSPSQPVIITLTGDLGAGKTTLVKELLKKMGVHDEVLSPTFTYVNCYKNDQGKKIFHFDLYRVSNLNQFLELGFNEYLYEPNSICLIEWPQVINDILEALLVFRLEIEHTQPDLRKIKVT